MGCYPKWLDNLADDVILEAPAMNGVLQGANVVHTAVTSARELYEFQQFHFTGRLRREGLP